MFYSHLIIITIVGSILESSKKIMPVVVVFFFFFKKIVLKGVISRKDFYDEFFMINPNKRRKLESS